MTTVPAHSFSAPARAVVIAAARLMPGRLRRVGVKLAGAHDAHAVKAPVRDPSCGYRVGPAAIRIAPVTVDPKSLGGPERVERTLGNMEANIGYVPGHRRAHGRGIAFRGDFTASPEAAALTIAEHMQGDRIAVTVRLSNGDGNPYAQDRNAVLGLAVRFALPSGDTSEWAALNIKDFPARKPDDFAGLAGAQKKNKKGKPNPLRLGLFVLDAPRRSSKACSRSSRPRRPRAGRA